MASAWIVTREGKRGTRYLVRFRRGGADSPQEYAGSFTSKDVARKRRLHVEMALEVSDDPLALMRPAPRERLVREVAAAWLPTIATKAQATVRNYTWCLEHINAGPLADLPCTLEHVKKALIREWFAQLAATPSETTGKPLGSGSITRIKTTLALILEHAGLDPNPAYGIGIPKEAKRREDVDPPTLAQVEAMVQQLHPSYRLAVLTLAGTGMRVGELCGLMWSDLDAPNGRWRVFSGKTKAARRWITPPADILAAVCDEYPAEGLPGDARVFPLSPHGVRAAMYRACRAAGISSMHPHALRHRWASEQIAAGVPIPQVAAALGHAKHSFTWDTYVHAIVSED